MNKMEELLPRLSQQWQSIIMRDLRISDFVTKLVYLEESVGHRTSYQLLEPFRLVSQSTIDLQSAGKRIGKFLGLEGLIFIIGFAKQADSIGGHIELQDDSQDVFVEISPDMREFPQSILATLGHEITHKYLHTHRLYKSYDKKDELDNEVLTDIAAVYLGLGKLMMNGCEVQKSWTVSRGNGTETTTQTFRSGYLTRNQFSVVYKLVTSMRGTSYAVGTDGLSDQARQALVTDLYPYRKFFKVPFGDPEHVSSTNDTVSTKASTTLDLLNAVEAQVDYLEDIANRYVRAFLIKARKRVAEKKAELDAKRGAEVFNPALRYLLGAQTAFKEEEFEKEMSELFEEGRNHLAYLSKAATATDKFSRREFPHFPSPPIVEKNHRKRKWQFWKRRKQQP